MEKNFLFLLLFCLILETAGAQTPQPFWKAKSQVYDRIKNERAIIVSAKTQHDDKGKRSITLITAGRIRAPLDFVHGKVTDYAQYAKILPYVIDVNYDPETKKLFAAGAFLGFKSHATLEMNSSLEKGQGKISFKVISGFMSGLTGTITEEKIEDKITEVSMDSVYNGEAAIPGFLLSYGLEFVGQRMAGSMRSFVESQWEKEEI